VLFNNLAQQTGGQDRIAFNFSNDYQALKKDSRAAQQQLANIQQAVEQEDYDRVSPEQVAQVGEKVKGLSSQVAALTEQSSSIANFQRGLSGMTAGLRDLAMGGADVRTTQGAEKLSEEELNRRTVLYFPEEKAEIQKQTDNALTALQTLVANGQMSPDLAGITALELLTIRDNAFAAKPNNVMAQAVNASYDAGAGLVDRAVDVMYFDQLNALAEMFPKTGEAVGTYMLVSFKGARTVSQAVGVGGLIYFGATAAASTGAMLVTAYGVAKVAEKFGVDEAPATLLGILASIGVGKIKPLQKGDIALGRFVEARASRLSSGLREAASAFGKSMRSESGRLYVGGFGRSQKPILLGETVETRLNPIADEIGAHVFNPSSKDPNRYFINQKRWIREQIKSGRQIFDVGLDPNRGKRSPFYDLETKELMSAGYHRVSRGFRSYNDLDGFKRRVEIFEWIKK
jgi:hypothetical protein